MITAIVSLLLSLSPAAAPSFRHYSTQQGLSQVTVHSIAQDADGRIWIGTGDGLSCLNGHSWSIYRNIDGDCSSIRDDEVTGLYTDCDGDIWASTVSGVSVYSMSEGRFINYEGMPESVGCILDPRNNLPDSLPCFGRILLCSGNKIISFDKQSGGQQILWEAPQAVGSIKISGDRLWICVPQEGLYLWTPSGPRKIFAGSLASACMCPAPEGSVWFCPCEGISRISPEGSILAHHGIGSGLPASQVRAMEYDSQGELWIGFSNNLCILHSDGSISTVRHINDAAESISGGSINCIFRDSSGGMWVGTFYGGADYHHPYIYVPRWVSMQDKVPGSDDIIRALAFDSDGRLWISTSRSGLFQYNIETRQVEYGVLPARGQEDRGTVNAIRFTGSDMALLGTSLSGLSMMDGNQRISKLSRDIKWVLSIEPTGDKEYIVAAADGVYVYDDDSRDVYLLTSADESSGSTFYAKADSLTLWVGYKKYLCRYEMHRGKDGRLNAGGSVRYPDIPTVQSILFSGGKKWFASTGGLFCLNAGDTLESRFGAKEGWPTNQMRGLEQDGYGRIWVSTENGIVRYDPATGDKKIWGLEDGLISAKFNPYAHCTGPDGRVYFGSNAGICSITSRPKPLITWAPAPLVTGILINGEPSAATGGQIELKHYHHSIDILMDVPDFISGENARIEFRCDGVDQDWRKADNSRKATYTNLPKGKHAFTVRYRNDSGIYSPTRTILTLRARPAWYGTLAFQLFMIAAAIIGISYLFVRKQRLYDSTLLTVRKEAREGISKVRAGSLASHPLTQKENEFLVMVLDLVDKNVSNELFGVQELARALGMSRSNLNIRLKPITDLSPLDIIRKVRMDKAYALLSTKKYSVSEVAAESGFNSSTYFATCFKKETGMSPSEWMAKL